ncbi:MAG: LytR/AlgR family response regulator transcription factor [Clostridium butyricum]
MLLHNIMLVEDDYIQRESLKKMILSINNSLKIYEAESETQALEIIRNNNIDNFFIDIQLKDSSGLGLALKIRENSKYKFNLIVFVTTYMEYITQAFKQTHCYDYILKPYDKDTIESILTTMDLYREKESTKKIEAEKYKKIVLALKGNIYVQINVNDIIYIEVLGRHCDINTVNGIYTTNNISLRKIMKMIESKNIIQSHRGFVVNIRHIEKIKKIDNKLSEIYFINSTKTALLGYKFKNDLLYEFQRDKIILG